MRPDTKLVAFEPAPGDPCRPNSTPIYQTATFAQESALEFGRYDYTRSGNPTRDVLERHVARLESASRAFAFASGMAAIAALLRQLPAGSRIVAGDDLYGGSVRWLDRIGPRNGLSPSYVDASDLAAVERALDGGAKLVLVETPSNPRLSIADIAAIAELAHRRGALLAVDNSAMSPHRQRPLELGADIVLHSATKHLGGHGDATGGIVAVKDDALASELAFFQNAEGTALAPFECWLLLRGIKTLGVRIEREEQSALAVAEFLARSKFATRVHHPGLAAHPGREVHARQASGTGCLVSFETGDADLSRRWIEALELFTIAVSFGSTDSQASLPCWMSHKSVPKDRVGSRTLPRDLVRLSIGLEDPLDLIEDLERGLEIARRARSSGRLDVRLGSP